MSGSAEFACLWTWGLFAYGMTGVWDLTLEFSTRLGVFLRNLAFGKCHDFFHCPTCAMYCSLPNKGFL